MLGSGSVLAAMGFNVISTPTQAAQSLRFIGKKNFNPSSIFAISSMSGDLSKDSASSSIAQMFIRASSRVCFTFLVIVKP